MILHTLLPFVMVALAVAMALSTWRLLRGPDLPDRILALDTLSINALALLLTLGLWQGTQVYFEVGLLIALLGFISTVALARFAAYRAGGQ